MFAVASVRSLYYSEKQYFMCARARVCDYEVTAHLMAVRWRHWQFSLNRWHLHGIITFFSGEINFSLLSFLHRWLHSIFDDRPDRLTNDYIAMCCEMLSVSFSFSLALFGFVLTVSSCFYLGDLFLVSRT